MLAITVYRKFRKRILPTHSMVKFSRLKRKVACSSDNLFSDHSGITDKDHKQKLYTVFMYLLNRRGHKYDVSRSLYLVTNCSSSNSFLRIICRILTYTHTHTHTHTHIYIYRVSQEEGTKLRESVPYVKIYRYNPKHLYPKLNGYGDNGQRKVWSSGGSTYCTYQLSSLIDVCPWVWCPITESPLTLAYSSLIPECDLNHVTSVLAFMCHV